MTAILLEYFSIWKHSFICLSINHSHYISPDTFSPISNHITSTYSVNPIGCPQCRSSSPKLEPLFVELKNDFILESEDYIAGAFPFHINTRTRITRRPLIPTPSIFSRAHHPHQLSLSGDFEVSLMPHPPKEEQQPLRHPCPQH